MRNSEIAFQFVGNDLALDLVNTRAMTGGVITDLLSDRSRLADWLVQVAAPPLSRWSEDDVALLFRLREACLELSSAHKTGASAKAAAIVLVNTLLQDHRQPLALSQPGAGFVLSEDAGNATPRAFLAQIAHGVARLITETDANRLKTCAHPDCVLMFKDTSKGGRRRWCSMETCGNRTKAATFRAGKQA